MSKKNLILSFFLALISIGFAPMVQGTPLAQHWHGHDCATATHNSLGSDIVATLVDIHDYYLSA